MPAAALKGVVILTHLELVWKHIEITFAGTDRLLLRYCDSYSPRPVACANNERCKRLVGLNLHS